MKNKDKKSGSVSGVLRLVTEIVVFFGALAAIVPLLIQNSELKIDKVDIFKSLYEIIDSRDSAIQKLYDENYLIRNQLYIMKQPQQRNRIQTYEVASLKSLYGNVVLNNNFPLSNVKINIEGGTQIYSNSNGEFFIDCKIGQKITFEKEGYAAHEFVLGKDRFNKYQKITLFKL
jgi:hypothetical protein